MIPDLRQALRSLFLRPSASLLTAILVMATGIGATTAVFSVLDLLLFRSLPYPNSSQLVSIGLSHPIIEGEFLLANDYLHLREQMPPALTAVTSLTGAGDCDLTEPNPVRLACAQVEATFLSTLGIDPIAGRDFTKADDREGAPKVALISHGLWQARFAGDRHALESVISLDGTPVRIIGVLPRAFEFPNLQKVDLLVPQALRLQRYTPGDSGRPLRVFARLAPETSIPQARQSLQPLVDDFMKSVPAVARGGTRFTFRSMRDFQIQDVKLASQALLGTSLAILFLVCANVATLLLARAEVRQKEFVMRRALGASRWQLVRLTLAESIILSLISGTLASGLALALLNIVKSTAPATIPRINQATLDTRVLLFALAATLLCGILSGLAPALTGLNLETLAGWRAVTGTRYALRRILVVAQIAISLMLLTAAGFLIESWNRLTGTHSGMNAANVITADITIGTQNYPNSIARQLFFNRLVERLRGRSLVEGVAISDSVPPAGFIHNRPLYSLDIPGVQQSSGIVDWRQVTPEYFHTLGIPLVRGRTFNSDDKDPVILNQKLAAKLFGTTADPLGQRIKLRFSPTVLTVVGVAADVDNSGTPGAPDPEYYVPRAAITDPAIGADASLLQRSLHVYDGEAFVTVRTSASPEVAAQWIRADLAALGPGVPAEISTMSARIASVTSRPRFQAMLMSAFGIIGVLLAVSGLYGLISYLVVRRTQEIGIRLALGATGAHIMNLIAKDALAWCTAGIAMGIAGALALTQILRSVIATENVSVGRLLLAAAIIILTAGLIAALRPAFEAARVDPVRAIRHE